MKRKTEILILIGIVVLGLLLRFYGIDRESYWIDEGFTLHDIAKPNLGIVMKDIIKGDAIAPFYLVAIYYWKSFFGISEFAIRAFSALFGSLSIILVYLVSKEFTNKKTSLFSAFLFSIAVPEILFSQEARVYALATFLALLSTYFLILALKKNRAYTLFYSLFSILLVYTLYFSAFLFVFQFLAIYYLRREKTREFFIGAIITFMFFLPWIPSLINQFLSHRANMRGTLENFLHLPGFIANFGFFLFLIPFIFFIIFFALILKLEKNKKTLSKALESENLRTAILIALVLCYLFLSYILVFKGTFGVRYLMFFSPVFYIALAYLLFSIRGRNRAIFVFITILLFVLAAAVFYTTDRKADWKQAIGFIESGEGANEIIVLSDGGNIYLFNFYYKGNNEIVPLIYPNLISEKEFSSKISGKQGIWLVLSRNWFDETSYKAVIQEDYSFLENINFKDIDIYHYGKDKT